MIGADGLHSQVRRLVFGPEYQFEKNLGYAVAAFEVQGYRPHDAEIYVMYGEPKRMLGRFTLHAIPLRLENPKIGRIDDTEVVGDGVTVKMPVFGDFIAQERQRGVTEIVELGVASVVRDFFMHQAP